MRRKFLTNLILLVFLNLLVKTYWVFYIDIGVQNEVGTSEYGFYFTIFNFAFLFQILLDMGITNYNNRTIAQNNHLLSKHFSSIIILRFLFAIIYGAVILGIGYSMNYSPRQMQMLTIIGFNQFLLSLILYLRSNISALLLFKVDSFISVLDRILMIAICAVLLWGGMLEGDFKIEYFVYAQTAAYAITAVLAFSFLFRRMKLKSLNWSMPFFIMIIKKSMPYALLIFFMGLYSRIDSVLIDYILLDDGKLQAGIYASAFRLFDAANNMSGLLFAGLLLPIFAKLIKEKSDLSQLVKLSFTLLFMLSTAVATISYFYGEAIIKLLYHQHAQEGLVAYNLRIEESGDILKILMAVFVFTSTTYIFGTLLTANGSLRKLNIIAFIGVVISLILNIALIPQMQAQGSAWANLSAQGVTALLQVYIAFRILPIKFDSIFLFRMFFFVFITIVLSWVSLQIPIHWIGKISILGISIIGLAFALQLLNVKTFLNIIQNEK